VTRATDIERELKALGDAQTALFSQRFFKTGAGEYGEGDLFRGIRVPVLRRIARDYQVLSLTEILKLLHSAYHEDRLVALLIMNNQFVRRNDVTRKAIYQSYLKNIEYIDSWDLVDTSAPQIVGGFLWDKDRKALYKLAQSKSLWKRRIAVLATFHFIKRGETSDSLKIASLLLSDPEDLIHKAVGWMLREVGKRNLHDEEEFLKQHYRRMPRTMLRYAVERFPEPKRQRYLKGKI
jgi:3-methyladenine DNA glycosylase AlkD